MISPLSTSQFLCSRTLLSTCHVGEKEEWRGRYKYSVTPYRIALSERRARFLCPWKRTSKKFLETFINDQMTVKNISRATLSASIERGLRWLRSLVLEKKIGGKSQGQYSLRSVCWTAWHTCSIVIQKLIWKVEEAPRFLLASVRSFWHFSRLNLVQTFLLILLIYHWQRW